MSNGKFDLDLAMKDAGVGDFFGIARMGLDDGGSDLSRIEAPSVTAEGKPLYFRSGNDLAVAVSASGKDARTQMSMFAFPKITGLVSIGEGSSFPELPEREPNLEGDLLFYASYSADDRGWGCLVTDADGVPIQGVRDEDLERAAHDVVAAFSYEYEIPCVFPVLPKDSGKWREGWVEPLRRKG